MDIHKVAAFAKVYELRSFSKAAKELYLSQPTVSAHVAALESELDILLFDRIGRSVIPTKAGHILYRHAKVMFEAMHFAKAEIRQLQDRVAGEVDIGGSSIPAQYILPRFLAWFHGRYPEVHWDLRIGDSSEMLSAVQDGTLMLAVVGSPPTHPDVQARPLVRDDVALVMSPALAQQYAHVQGADLVRALPWVVREVGSGTRLVMERVLWDLGVAWQEIRTVAVVRQASIMAQCLEAGMGAGLTSVLTVHDALRQGRLVRVALPGVQVERNFYLVYHSKQTLFPAVLRLMDELTTWVADRNVLGDVCA